MEYRLESRLWESARQKFGETNVTNERDAGVMNLKIYTGTHELRAKAWSVIPNYEQQTLLFQTLIPFLLVFYSAPSPSDPALSLLSPPAATLKQRGYPSRYHGSQECREKKNVKIKGRIFVLFGESS